MEEHFALCKECRNAASDLSAMEEHLRVSASIFRNALSMVNGPTEELFQKWILRGNDGYDDAFHRMLRLKAFLSPICGYRTAERIMTRSSKRMLLGSLDTGSESEWLEFLQNVISTIEALCGGPTSRFLWEIGHCSL